MTSYSFSPSRRGRRIDARPQNDPATQAGMRNVHRDMRRNVIAATTPEGQRIRSDGRAWQTPLSGMDRKIGLQPGVSQLGAPATPGLDRLAAMQSTGPRMSFADQEKAARKKSAASGAFGAKPQNLAGRQQLFVDMQAAGSGAQQSPDLAKRAASLGVSKSAYNRAWSKIPQAPAMLARPAANPSNNIDYGMASENPVKPRGKRVPMI
jgi:hypothetical protein